MLKVTCKRLAALALAALITGQAMAAQSTAPQKQRQLIGVLQSNAAAAEKAITCKQLAIYGTEEAVPALAALLPDKDLSSWARIALEAIPGPEADAALRDALGKVQGRLLVGVINSIGYRRDAKAAEGLVQKLTDSDTEVASCAAAALGRIGGEKATSALVPMLGTAPTAVRSAVAEGCILLAEGYLAKGDQAQAVKLYDAVRGAEVPKQRVLEGIRGAVLARGQAGVPLLAEQLKSTDKAIFGIALRIARELSAGQVTDVLLAEMAKTTPDRQSLLILTLADRGDAKALPAVLQAAKAGEGNVRLTAVSVMDRLGNVSCVPVLVDAAANPDAELSLAAKTSLARLVGADVDAEIFRRLQASSGRQRQVLIELAEQRRIDGALAVFVKCAEDPDAGVRTAALVALGAIGDDRQAEGLVKLLQKARDEKERTDIEKALMSISARHGAATVQHLLPLAKSGDSATRLVALNALACCGGAEALAAVRAAVDDREESVQDEAVRTLSNWPNRWPDDAAVTQTLLSLAKSGKKPVHQLLAIRGYLRFVQGARRLPADQRLAKVNEIMPLINRPEEKRLAISALSAIGSAAVLDPLVKLVDDPAVAEEACTAVLGLLGKSERGVSRDVRRSALQKVIDKSQADATKQRAKEMLDRVG